MGHVQMKTRTVGSINRNLTSMTRWCSIFWFICFAWDCGADSTAATKLLYHRQHLIHERAATVTIERTGKPFVFPEDRHEDNHIDSISNIGSDSNDNLLARRRLFSSSGSSQNNISSNRNRQFHFSSKDSADREIRDESSLRPRINYSPAHISTSLIRFPGSTRTGRTLEGTASNNTKSGRVLPNSQGSLGKSDNESSSSVESSRKASPDVQDIIDGIVKLLGGKVHNPQVQQQNNYNYNSQQPVQPQKYQPVQQPPTSQSPAYNLFNPTKPVFFQTSKPTRINNRGPPLVTTTQQNSPVQNVNSDRNHNSFEAIPLEVLNSDFNLNETRFGPPFPLGQVIHPGADAPYKKGVPLPEQLVPHSDFETQSPPHSNFGYTTKGHGEGGNQPYGQYTPPSSLDAYLEQINGQNNAYEYGNKYHEGTRNPDISEQPHTTTTYATTGEINVSVPSNDYDGDATNSGKRPNNVTSLLVPVIQQLGSSSIPNKTNSGTFQLGSPRPPVDVTSPESSPSIPITLPEDDEEDDLRFTTNVNPHLDKKPVILGTEQPIHLESTITDDFQLPTFITSLGSGSTASETTINFSEVKKGTGSSLTFNGASAEKIRPTATSASVYPTLVLETNGNNGLEIVTKTTVSSTFSSNKMHSAIPQRPPLVHPNSNLHKQVQEFNAKTGGTSNAPVSTTSKSTTSLSSQQSFKPTPPLRPGIVINEGSGGLRGDENQGYGSVEIVSADSGHTGKLGDVFDVTVTAKQNYGGQVTGQPFVIPVDLKDELITQPVGNQQFVSIDGKRTYFNLHPNTAPGTTGASQTVGNAPPPVSNKAPVPSLTTGVGTVGAPVPVLQPGKSSNKNPFITSSGGVPGRAVSTSLSISGGGNSSGGGIIKPANKTPQNIVRRPLTRRPSVPPVRIDTCIVGDDSTCNAEQFESCRTESGVSSCVCRAGFARRRHREPCRAIISLVLSIRLDKLGDKKLTYNPDYFNSNSELYQSLEWETIHALDSTMGETTLSPGYVGSKLDAIGFDGRHVVVNTTVLIQENPKLPVNQVQREIKKQVIHILTKNRNNFGKSQLWVEGPISALSAVTDLNECENSDLYDCDPKAKCVNTYGSFECKCDPGYGDPYEKDRRKSGRKCETCNGRTQCNGRGECLIEDGQKYCKCSGNYYGPQCDIDGEVLAVAIGASVSAIVIIGLTLACLCMWSRRWKKEEQKAALMSRTLFGGMASQALSYLSKNTMSSSNPYQQHVTMDERLRWAQVADTNLNGNIYVQNEPLSLHASPPLMGTSLMETPPMTSARRSAETMDSTVDDIFDERHQIKRPRSRTSQMQGGIYYDLEPESGGSEMYASRPMVPFPAQFCVPMSPMNHFTHTNRGFYN